MPPSDELSRHLEIRRLSSNDAKMMSCLLQEAKADDRKFFDPFPFDVLSVRTRLESAVFDRFIGLFIDGETLAGFYMLRGMDEGYLSPMYGVFIGPEFRRHGLARLTLCHAFSVCKLSAYPSLMLRVHPENERALQLYRNAGFEVLRSESNQYVMEQSFAGNC